MVEFDEGDMHEDEGFMRHFRGMHGEDPDMSDYMDYLESETDSYVEEDNTDSQHAFGKTDISSNPDCPRCGNKMVQRKGHYGSFWGCTTFPQCRGTRKIDGSTTTSPNLNTGVLPMGYEVFEIDFIHRTLDIIEQYGKYVKLNVPQAEQYEVTLFINCLLGLLVLPKELHFESIPDIPITKLEGWGLKAEHVTEPGVTKNGLPRNIDELTLKEFVKDMRDSVAHILFKTYTTNNQITHLEFYTDKSKIRVMLSLQEFRQFILKLVEPINVAAAHNTAKNDTHIDLPF